MKNSKRIEKENLAEILRKAFEEAITKNNTTVAAAAKAAGMPNGNLIYNFLHRRSGSLSTSSFVRLVKVLPGFNLSEIFEYGSDSASLKGPIEVEPVLIGRCDPYHVEGKHQVRIEELEIQVGELEKLLGRTTLELERARRSAAHSSYTMTVQS